MLINSSAAIKRALVAHLRADTSLNGLKFFEGFAPPKQDYPFVTYLRISAPYDYDWTSVTLRTAWDISVWSRSPVEAEDLDALVSRSINDTSLSVSEQSTLICRRYADLGDRDIDEEGKPIFMAGGSYTIWTSQTIPVTQENVFSGDAVLS